MIGYGSFGFSPDLFGRDTRKGFPHCFDDAERLLILLIEKLQPPQIFRGNHGRDRPIAI